MRRAEGCLTRLVIDSGEASALRATTRELLLNELRNGPRSLGAAFFANEAKIPVRFLQRYVRTGASDAVGYSGSYFRSRRCRAYRHKQSLKPRHAQKSMPSMRHQVACRAETSLRLQERGVSKSHGGGEDEYRGLTRFGDVLVCQAASSARPKHSTHGVIRAPARTN